MLKKDRISLTAHLNKADLVKNQRKGLMMVITNSSSNLLLRLPELTSIIFFYIFSFGGQTFVFKKLCFDFRLCLSIIEMANLFYIIAISINFFIYYLFNKNFKYALKKLFFRLKSFLKRLFFCKIF
jgi:hypothetical protein